MVGKNFSPESLQFDLKSFIPVAVTLVPENNRKTVKQNLQEMTAAKDYSEAEEIFQSLLRMYESALPELTGLLEENFRSIHNSVGFRIPNILAAAGNASGLGRKVVSYLSGRHDELAKKIGRPARRRVKKAEESRNVQKTQKIGHYQNSPTIIFFKSLIHLFNPILVILKLN